MAKVYFRWKMFLISIIFLVTVRFAAPFSKENGYETFLGFIAVMGIILFVLPIYKLLRDWWYS